MARQEGTVQPMQQQVKSDLVTTPASFGEAYANALLERGYKVVIVDKLNAKESFQTILNSLKSTEISSINNDTKALIDTQKQLMETLQSMGPALKEGKTILDTFKNYFNDSNLDKLSM